jgi:hypothetical protein
MPRNSKNSVKVNSNQFELLNVEDDSTNDNVARSISVANAIDVTDTADATDATDATNTTRTSARGRPLKPTAVRPGTATSTEESHCNQGQCNDFWLGCQRKSATTN